MKDYYFEGSTFVIKNYNRQKTFANFLPGVAGKKGIPLWSFYVNRAQAISGYGLKDKANPIMEFTPANKAYETVGTIGFRTFYKIDGMPYEAFKGDQDLPHEMRVNKTSLSLIESNESLGIKTKITYFGLVNEPLAGLVRKVEVENIGKTAKTIEMLDGITQIFPAGVHNENFKSSSNLLASWMDVNHLDDNLAYYKLRASTNDSSEVKENQSGNFYLGLIEGEMITPIIDQDLIFGYNSSKSIPVHFNENALNDILKTTQVTANKIPCGFIPYTMKLKPGETRTLHAISGHAESYRTLKSVLKRLTSNNRLNDKEQEASMVIETLLKDVETDTALPMFNEYIKQNYLDNFLRGGYPIEIGKQIYHLYSRRHGDLERDYNYFSLAPEYYSQGAGNFRDVCQNRRMDTFINKNVERFNIHHFASLIQLDGYNPLSVNGTLYTLDKETAQKLIDKHFKKADALNGFFKTPFTPGKIVNYVENHNIEVKTSEKAYLDDIINQSHPNINAAFGEGFWSDHFSYVLDLVESYESIYPERMKELLYKDESFLYFESPISVLKQSEKAVINTRGQIRQYGSLRHFDKEKIKRLKLDPHASNFAKLNEEYYRSNLYVKLLSLTMNKHSLLDPEGYGIEMEANKPGWNDAMNGVPGLFGSGVSETIETLRIVDYLIKHHQDATLNLPIEMYNFFEALKQATTYAARLKARETYRKDVRFGLCGEFKSLDSGLVQTYLKALSKSLHANLERLYHENDGIVPTFITYDVTDYEALNTDGKPTIGHYGLPLVKPKAFKKRFLPNFLESPARLMKVNFDAELLRQMHEKITKSEIYDPHLKMYKTSGCLEEESHEIGRIRAFTQGWLERESNFLHMNYKYLLGLLKSGLYDAFYEALKTNLVCFMNPKTYGRSTLENSSFIVPTNNPNPKIHGQGFFARLTGSTVETIHMWSVMMTGGVPFKERDNQLVLKFEPKLSKAFFKSDKTLSFTFLKDITVTYINESMQDTYTTCDIHKMVLSNNKTTKTIEGDVICGDLAIQVRDGIYKNIKIYMN